MRARKIMIPQFINLVLGLWLMAAAAVLDYARPAAMIDQIIGPLIATFACIALWEACRPMRWLNVPLGLALVILPWPLGYPAIAAANSVVVGLAAAALATRGGSIQHAIGGGWSMLWRGQEPTDAALRDQAAP
jgi:hypothetical protein